MGVPLAEVSDRSVARSPTQLRYRTMAKRHALEESAPLAVQPRRRRCLGNKHALAMYRAKK